MTRIVIQIVTLAIAMVTAIAGYGQKNISVDHFDKVIVSPHIEVTFKEGTTENVRIENAKVPDHKINVRVEGKTLRIYLEGAKMVTKQKKVYDKRGWKTKKPIYPSTMVTATITYKHLKELSIRGEEVILCESPIKREDFKLKMYGESKVTVNDIQVNSLGVTMYGEGYLEIKDGMVDRQKYTVYGEGEINTLGLNNESTKITAYGEGNFRVNVSEDLRITAYGEPTIAYDGDPSINKGIVIGRATIRKMN